MADDGEYPVLEKYSESEKLFPYNYVLLPKAARTAGDPYEAGMNHIVFLSELKVVGI